MGGEATTPGSPLSGGHEDEVESSLQPRETLVARPEGSTTIAAEHDDRGSPRGERTEYDAPADDQEVVPAADEEVDVVLFSRRCSLAATSAYTSWRSNFWTDVSANTAVWVPLLYINFRFVPLKYRWYYLSTSGVLWALVFNWIQFGEAVG